ncbi:TetR family transcriptional regulator [Saccharothrix sp. ALI-22-I]|uniref:TetR/AcrR family transcriptional regulator n=1 Tax=Saccharothrix sp. ALI-22-I TaxID=1933778 RepID=UPI00097CA50E|nr:TetR/AcrR family transcriptional regulator [Saccharothrix sp. ALI-22-I]ONI85592.1 TetR family transcriptional regulator [Saccharothrix sp. ALI-22-I]
MATGTERHLRADAARNAERILGAAREVYADLGPDAPLEEIARRAGVGIRTLYRRFPNKEELVRAALEHGIAEQLAPAIGQALGDDDPKRGLVTLFEAALSMADRERNILAAANNSGTITAEVSAPLIDSLSLLTRRGQEAGVIRADLTPEDMHRVLGMLVGVLWTMNPGGEGWRRYVALVVDGLCSVAAGPLPPLVPFVEPGDCLI